MTRKKPYITPLSFEIKINNLHLGDSNPVAIQSMANTNTLDISSSTEQLLRIIHSGAEMVRFTTQGLKEVESLQKIASALKEKDINIPIVADVHFNAKVAYEAARICDKVRINPGNFTEKRELNINISEEEYNKGLSENRKKLITLINICKTHHTAIRIGVNHGSLSGRIMSRYGDTSEGMVESALEFLRVCKEENFQNVVVSLKSSNTRVMVYSVRLLVKQMLLENLYFPVHLGVTESGDGIEGRIKSVVGIAPLLMEGIGDTIRVSLTEPPENELPVANQIRLLFPKPVNLPYNPLKNLPWNPFQYEKLNFHEIMGIGGSNPPVVISNRGNYNDPIPDIQAYKETEKWKFIIKNEEATVYSFTETGISDNLFGETSITESPEKVASISGSRVIILNAGSSSMTAVKNWLISYIKNTGLNPVILRKSYSEKEKENYAIKASGEFGFLLIDGLLSGIWLENRYMSDNFNNKLSFYILQASRNRTTSTEYIACPSCGRTLFDIQSVLKKVKERTSHLKTLKIAVMGCIVNGPGEMADADYGYIGVGKGLVSIYKGQTVLMKNIPAENAVQSLIDIIKENGDWTEP